MADAEQISNSLLTEHFTYTPLSFIDDTINRVNEIIYQFIPQLEASLLDADPATLGFRKPDKHPSSSRHHSHNHDQEDAAAVEDKSRAEIENGVNQLETLLEATLDKNFDRFELYCLNNIFKIPPELGGWVKLKHYEGLTPPPPPPQTEDPSNTTTATSSSQHQQPTPQSLTHLRRKLRETQKLHSALTAESTRNAALISSLHSLLLGGGGAATTTTITTSPTQKKSHSPSPPNPNPTQETTPTPTLSFLNSTNTNNLTTQTHFLLTQLPALQALLSTLRPTLSTLPRAVEDVDWKGSKAEERRRYIEGRTRRHLRRKFGLAPGEGGDADVGRRVGEGEVGFLEGFLGGGDGEDGDEGDGDRMEE
ncbi:MAG: hypothetical protein M1834_000184 [Cirrosporium novae-zelandiae]|nr:MAG: hypothetical protein M1834_000184 [Cirrosporium novae-zelandiae]